MDINSQHCGGTATLSLESPTHTVTLIQLKAVYCTTQSVNNATNCSFFLSLSLSLQHVSALNGHLQVYYYAKTATLH
jgi:hypothetical protein